MLNEQDAADDLSWLEILAGREAVDASPSCRIEASWLRAAMLSVRLAAPAGDVPGPEDRILPLLARARAVGLLSPDVTAPSSGEAVPAPASLWGHWADRLRGLLQLRVAWAGALAGALVLMFVFWPLLQPSHDELVTPTLRGPAVQVRQAADPLAEQAALAASLRQASFEVTLFERLGRPSLEITMPESLTNDQRVALKRLSLERPQGSVLVVEIRRAP